jgi:hypothetical protein
LVKAFNTVYFEHLATLARPRGASDRSSLAIAGEDQLAKCNRRMVRLKANAPLIGIWSARRVETGADDGYEPTNCRLGAEAGGSPECVQAVGGQLNGPDVVANGTGLCGFGQQACDELG